jgi:hypothetical protein
MKIIGEGPRKGKYYGNHPEITAKNPKFPFVEIHL